MKALKKLAEAQATDAGLWFMAKTAPEAYLQEALRRLHQAVGAQTGDTPSLRAATDKPDK